MFQSERAAALNTWKRHSPLMLFCCYCSMKHLIYCKSWYFLYLFLFSLFPLCIYLRPLSVITSFRCRIESLSSVVSGAKAHGEQGRCCGKQSCECWHVGFLFNKLRHFSCCVNGRGEEREYERGREREREGERSGEMNGRRERERERAVHSSPFLKMEWFSFLGHNRSSVSF